MNILWQVKDQTCIDLRDKGIIHDYPVCTRNYINNLPLVAQTKLWNNQNKDKDVKELKPNTYETQSSHTVISRKNDQWREGHCIIIMYSKKNRGSTRRRGFPIMSSHQQARQAKQQQHITNKTSSMERQRNGMKQLGLEYLKKWYILMHLNKKWRVPLRVPTAKSGQVHISTGCHCPVPSVVI